MWLTLDEAMRLGLNPSDYRNISKQLRVVIAENHNLEMCVFADLKTGSPVLYFETCETLAYICCNLKEVDKHLVIGITTVARLLEILEAHAAPS